MINSRRSIFRESAMKQYAQKREQDILPRVVSPPFFVYAWLLLSLIVIASVLLWLVQMPTYMAASGVVSAQGGQKNTAVALIFFPATNLPKLRVGQPIQVQIGMHGPLLKSTITQIESGTISPTDARNRYKLDAGAAQIVAEPSVVVIVQLSKTIPVQTYVGTFVSAQLQVGSHSVLSQLF